MSVPSPGDGHVAEVRADGLVVARVTGALCHHNACVSSHPHIATEIRVGGEGSCHALHPADETFVAHSFLFAALYH
jgi:hypothetical protein